MKAILFSLLIITSISLIIPSADAGNHYTGKAYDSCIERVDSKTMPLKQLDDCVKHWTTQYELRDLRSQLNPTETPDERLERIEQRHAETYNMQFLALGGTIAVCAIIGIVVLKFVILKKNR
jgi:hypothetical protein